MSLDAEEIFLWARITQKFFINKSHKIFENVKTVYMIVMIIMFLNILSEIKKNPNHYRKKFVQSETSYLIYKPHQVFSCSIFYFPFCQVFYPLIYFIHIYSELATTSGQNHEISKLRGYTLHLGFYHLAVDKLITI